MEYKISDKMKDMKPSAIREIFKSLGTPGAISFAAGNPSADSFPVDALRKIAADIFENSPSEALQYSVTEGYPPLRKAVADRLRERFAIDCHEKGMTLITSGGQQAIELACKVLCNEGDRVICEQPSFIGALNAFRSLGAIPVGVPIEDDGINISALEEALRTTPKVRMMYLIPTFQNPSSVTMSEEKRRAVYALARKYDVIIFEDNPYGELRFSGENIRTIKSMDIDGRVIYCGSFSKVLSAGMRIGFVNAPAEIAQKMVVAKQVEDVHSNIFFQMLCSRFLDEYDLESHLTKIKALYRYKCGCMLEALEKYMPDCVKYTHPEGGLFLWCTLPEKIDLGEFVRKASDNKVFVVPGSAFNCDEHAVSHSFRLNYSMPDEDEIDRGIQILANIVSDML